MSLRSRLRHGGPCSAGPGLLNPQVLRAAAFQGRMLFFYLKLYSSPLRVNPCGLSGSFVRYAYLFCRDMPRFLAFWAVFCFSGTVWPHSQ